VGILKHGHLVSFVELKNQTEYRFRQCRKAKKNTTHEKIEFCLHIVSIFESQIVSFSMIAHFICKSQILEKRNMLDHKITTIRTLSPKCQPLY